VSIVSHEANAMLGRFCC